MATAKTMFRTHVDLPEDVRQRMVACCNRQLATAFDLYSQTKHAHWNVKGPEFFQLHELFDTLAENVLEHVDLIAERATALGGFATGTARMAAKQSQLDEFPDITDGIEQVGALVERWGVYANSSRAAIDEADEAGDQGTSDMFTQIVRDADKDLWFLEAHVQR